MSELALELIAKEKKEKTGKLDLGNCGLTKIPEEVFELTWLEELWLTSSVWQETIWVESLNEDKPNDLMTETLPSELSLLVNLRVFYFESGLGQNLKDASVLGEFPGLEDIYIASRGLDNLAFLNGLSRLEKLFLHISNDFDFQPLERLQELTSLFIGSKSLRNIDFVSGLTKLKYFGILSGKGTDFSALSSNLSLKALYLNGLRIADVQFISELRNLEILYLDNNRVSNVESLKDLKKLKTLKLTQNKISDLSPLLPLIRSGVQVKFDGFGPGIYLDSNPIVKPPLEIANAGNEAILTYFDSLLASEEQGKGGVQLNEIKVLLLGEGMAGKTSLLKRLKGLRFNKHESKTHGINIEKLELGKLPIFKEYKELEKVALNVWDFGGQEIMHATHQIFLTNRSIYIYVIDSRTGAKKDYWLHHIERFGGESPAIVAINKVDKNPNFELERATINRKYPFIENRFHRISCKSGDGLEGLKRQLAELIPETELFKTSIPETWLRVKLDLEEATGSGDTRYIGEEEFKAICAKWGVGNPKERSTLLNFLHDLGVVFHFEKLRLKGFYVLDPLWVTVGIYRVINTYDITDGILKENRLDYILNHEEQKKEEYTPHDQEWEYKGQEAVNLLTIMEEFELLYPLGKAEYLVPDLLPKEPQEFTSAPEEALHFILIYDFLTQSLYNRLIVQMKDDIRDFNRVSGVQSYFENVVCEAQALVDLDLDKKRIDIRVWGREKRHYLTIIRDKLEKIHQSFSGLKVKRKLPIPGYEDELVDFDELIGLERMGEAEMKIGTLGLRLSISGDFLDKVTTKSERMEERGKSFKRQKSFGGGDIIIENKHTIQNYGGSAQATNQVEQKSEQQQANTQTVSISIQMIQHARDEADLLKESIEKERSRLTKKLEEDAVEDAINDLTDVQESLSQLEKSEEAKEQPPNKAKRVLGQVFEDFKDEDSPIRKTLKYLRRGKDYGVNLARQYNKVAEKFGFNPVPGVVLDALEKL